MLSIKKGFYTTFSEQKRKPQALSLTTSSLQVFQPSLLLMEARLITQALRLRKTNFYDRTNTKQQYAQQKKQQYNYDLSDFAKRRSTKQERNVVKQITQATIQQKNEQLISANVPEDQMKRIYQNAYDDLFQPLSGKL